MKVGILGLGLIGGSLARAYALEGHTVYAIQRNESMLSFAMLSGAVHGRLDETTIPECDLILLAIYPGGCADWLEKNAPLVSKVRQSRTPKQAKRARFLSPTAHVLKSKRATPWKKDRS